MFPTHEAMFPEEWVVDLCIALGKSQGRPTICFLRTSFPDQWDTVGELGG